MSSRPVQGIVGITSFKDFPDKRTGAPVRLYSFQLEGSNQWFRTGTNPLPAGKGDNIQFVADGQQVDTGSVQVAQSQVQKAPPVAATTTATTSSNVQSIARAEQRSGGIGRDEYWANKEARDIEKEARYISVQEPRMALSVAVEAASRVVEAALKSEALGFGTAAKAKRLGMLTAFIKETALELATFIHNAPEELKNYRPKEESEQAAVVKTTDE